jgi:hypothetical protein
MSAEIVDDQTVNLLTNYLPLVGPALGAAVVFVGKAIGHKVNRLTATVEDHQDRIVAIEQTYVSREDLEGIIDALQKDLRGSFERAHSRIDEIYRNPRKD